MTALIILDGWGHNPRYFGNAVAMARTPTLDALFAQYPHTLLTCAGESVGLREGMMGNSEVGHENLGAGRVVLQEILFIDKAIANGPFFSNPALVDAVRHALTTGGRLHLAGLTSDGGVHSAESHYFALLELAKRYGVAPDRVIFHAILDGRDTSPTSGIEYVRQLEAEMARVGVGRIGTVIGRYYAMDRDNRWERVRRAYDLYTAGLGDRYATAEEAILAGYANTEKNETDEFMGPKIITGVNDDVTMRDGDALIFFNFRGDRPREILHALAGDDVAMERAVQPKLAFCTLTQYAPNLKLPFAYKRERPTNILPEVVSAAGLTQLRIAETEKYAHVTFFFNNQREAPYDGERRVLINSPKVATYDLQPEMSAFLVAGACADEIVARQPDFIVLNFANADMVGHTGDLSATIKALEAVDRCLQVVLDRIVEAGGCALVTADHGNGEEEVNYEEITNGDGTLDYNKPAKYTQHSVNPVPCILVDPTRRHATLRANGLLADLAPTVLELLDLPQPAEMTGRSLLQP